MSKRGKLGVKQLRDKASAHLYAKRWRTSSGTVQVIVIAGPYGKRTTSKLLEHVLTQQNASVVVHNAEFNSAKDIHELLRKARKSKADFVLLRLDDALLDSGALASVTPELLVVPFCDTEANARLRYEKVRPKKYVYGLELGESPLENGDDTKIAFGESSRTDAVLKGITLYRKGTEVELLIDHQIKLQLATHLVGASNAHNIAAVVASVYVLHRPLDEIDEYIADIEQVDGNFETLRTDMPFSTIIDAAPDAKTVGELIASAKHLVKRRLIVAVEASRVGESNIPTIAEEVDRLVVIDVNDFKRDKPGIERVVSPDGVYRKVVQIARQGDMVLLCGNSFLRRDEHSIPLAVSGLAHATESH